MFRLHLLLLLSLSSSPPAAAADWWLIEDERSRFRQSSIFADAASIERRGDSVSISFALIATDEPPRQLSGGVLRIEMLCEVRQMRLVRREPLQGVRLPPSGEERFRTFRAAPGNDADPVARFACAGERNRFTHLPGVTDIVAEAERRFAEARRPPPPPPPLTAEERERRERSWGPRVESTIRRSLAGLCGDDSRCRGFAPTIERGAEPIVAVEDLLCTERRADEPAWRQPPERLACRFTARHRGTRRSAACTIELVRPLTGRWSSLRPRPAPPEAARRGMPFPITPAYDDTIACSSPLLPLVAK